MSAAARFESPGLSVPASPSRASASDARDYILMQTHYKKIIVEMDFSVGVTGQIGNTREFVVP
jgi:hypothetical protein